MRVPVCAGIVAGVIMDIKSIPEKIRAKMNRAQIWMRENEAVNLESSGYRRGVHYIGVVVGSPDGYIFGRLYDTAQFEPISRYYKDERTAIEQGRRFFNL